MFVMHSFALLIVVVFLQQAGSQTVGGDCPPTACAKTFTDVNSWSSHQDCLYAAMQAHKCIDNEMKKPITPCGCSRDDLYDLVEFKAFRLFQSCNKDICESDDEARRCFDLTKKILFTNTEPASSALSAISCLDKLKARDIEFGRCVANYGYNDLTEEAKTALTAFSSGCKVYDATQCLATYSSAGCTDLDSAHAAAVTCGGEALGKRTVCKELLSPLFGKILKIYDSSIRHICKERANADTLADCPA